MATRRSEPAPARRQAAPAQREKTAPAQQEKTAPVRQSSGGGGGGSSGKARGARSVNMVMLLGHLGSDAETRYTQSGTAVSQFSIATSRRWKPEGGDWKEETTWTRVIMWQQERTAEYLTKGKQVLVRGRLNTRSYEDKDGRTVYVTEVVSDEVILLGGGKSDGGQREQDGITDDDIPF